MNKWFGLKTSTYYPFYSIYISLPDIEVQLTSVCLFMKKNAFT